MSRQQVRQAVGQWVADAGIPNLNQVFTSFPKRINFQSNSQAGQLHRAAGVVFIQGETEERVALGGAYDGWKRIDYAIQFQVFCHSVASYAQDSMDAFDQIIDGVKDRLRSGGHTLGEADNLVIWQAAEPGISVDYAEPVTNEGGATELWAAVNFQVTQMIRA